MKPTWLKLTEIILYYVYIVVSFKSQFRPSWGWRRCRRNM